MSEDLFGKKENPFEVPDNYFEDFERRMTEKVDSQPAEEKGKVVSLFSAVKPWVAMAAGFLLIAVLYYQAPLLFDRSSEETQESVVVEESAENALINSLAFMVDQDEINELILSEDSILVLPSDAFYFGEFTEDELASLSYFDYN